jgi:mannose-6-phosphate isomerase-like protein (cupin superfamily)
VGANTLIYCPSNVKHSVTNISKTIAKIMTIDTSNEGEKSGILVYSKMPTGGDIEGKTWKVANK